MSDSNRVAVGYEPETVIGTSLGGQLQDVAISSESMSAQKGTVEGNTIRSDRNLRDVIQTNLIPQGGWAFDYIYGNMSGFMDGVFGSAWSSLVDITGVSATISSNVITAGAGTPYSVCVVNQVVRISLNGLQYLGRVSAIGGGGATITIVGVNIPDDAGAADIDIKGRYIRNGTTIKSYSLEVGHADLTGTGKFLQFLGQIPATYNLSAQAEQVITGDIDFLGLNAVSPASATISNPTSYLLAPTNEGFAALPGAIGALGIDGIDVKATVPVQGATHSIITNVRRDAAMNLVNMGWGTFKVTGQVTAFYQGGMDMVDDFYDHEDTSLWTAYRDPQGNDMSLYLPRVKLTNFTRNVGGRDQAVIGTFDYTAIYDSVATMTMQMDEIAASTPPV